LDLFIYRVYGRWALNTGRPKFVGTIDFQDMRLHKNNTLSTSSTGFVLHAGLIIM
jgi:hypothetical protein